MIIYLVPRGKPSPGAAWSDPRPRAIELTREDNNNWIGRPVANPACSELQYPKFAWEKVEGKQ